ncbi:MAG: SUMF1/EgtB/PvdO family nonheme iron enzyme, partial [Verrucomicrobiia bacterium]
RGPAEGSDRVTRGGSWVMWAKGCRAANRGFCQPTGRYKTHGFRSVLPADQ